MRHPKQWPVTAAILGTIAVCLPVGVLALVHGQYNTVLATAGGFGSFVVAALTYTVNRDKQTLDRDRYLDDRFASPIGHLADDNITVRVGGVQELDRILQYAPADRARVLALYSSFLRHAAPYDPAAHPDGPPSDMAAVLASLRARPALPGEPPLELSAVRMPGADLSGTDLVGARLTAANLGGARLRDARCGGADLTMATLVGADLAHADLSGARLIGARLGRADLTGAHLRGADLTDAMLDGAILCGADLRGALGCTTEQLASAVLDAETRPPDLG
jgi:hypothetical protein